MDEKLPYYMAYPMPLLYDDERQNQRDYEYMKSVYPGTAKRLIPYIEEECDRLEYTGSVMYDEYPDRLQLLLLCRRIYNRAKEDETKKDEAKKARNRRVAAESDPGHDLSGTVSEKTGKQKYETEILLI